MLGKTSDETYREGQMERQRQRDRKGVLIESCVRISSRLISFVLFCFDFVLCLRAASRSIAQREEPGDPGGCLQGKGKGNRKK